jgi:selenocysteine lyase/cysteine desulfurase
VEYLADLGRTLTGSDAHRGEPPREAYREIGLYERGLARFLAGLDQCRRSKFGHQRARERIEPRVATGLYTRALHGRRDGRALGQAGFFTWHGNYYALNLTESLGLEPRDARVGMVHYNTLAEVSAAGIAAWAALMQTLSGASYRR